MVGNSERYLKWGLGFFKKSVLKLLKTGGCLESVITFVLSPYQKELITHKSVSLRIIFKRHLIPHILI